MKTKVLIVLNNFEIGGAQNMVYELVRCIDRNKFEINVLCYGKRINNSLTEKIEMIQNVKYLNMTGKITLKVFIKVLHEISRVKPDILHSHLGGTVFAVPWGLLHKIQVVVTAHTKPEKAFSKMVIPFLKFGIRKKIVRLITVSKENQSLMMEFFNLSKDKCDYINNGINVNRYYRKEHEKFTFINVGRQDENKNQILIIKCFAELCKEFSEIMLYLVGDGDKHEMLIQEVNRLKLADKIILTGNVGNTEDYYAISDCYVQSSHREAMPLTALEAMAANLPLISTNVGGMKDIVLEDNGFLVDDGDERALYEAMKKVLTISSKKRNLLAIASAEIVNEFSAEKMTQKYEQLYLGENINL